MPAYDPSIETNYRNVNKTKGSNNNFAGIGNAPARDGTYVSDQYDGDGNPYWERLGYTREEFDALSPDEKETILVEAARMDPRDVEAVGLQHWMPSDEELTVNYEAGPLAEGPDQSHAGQARADQGAIDAQFGALEALQDVHRSGGITAADRQRQAEARRATGMAIRGQQGADMAAMQARGSAGAGVGLAGLQAGQQAGVMGLASQDADMQVNARTRALQAMQSAGQLGGTIRDQSFDEQQRTGNSIDRFNTWNTNRMQGYNETVATRANQTAESKANAKQQSYVNRTNQTAAALGQHVADTNTSLQQQARNDERTDRWIGTGGEVVGRATQ